MSPSSARVLPVIRVPVSPAIVKAAEAAWSRYASACRTGGTPAERAASYLLARQAEQHLWRAENRDAARCETPA